MGKKRAAFAVLVAVAAFAATMVTPTSAGAAERGAAHERETERAGEEEEESRLVAVERRDEIERGAFQAALRFDRGAGTSRFAQAAAVARALSAKQGDVPGAGGRWESVDKGPVVFDDPNYHDSLDLASGLRRAEGRITDFAYDPSHRRVFAAFGQGGLWVSDDRATTWRSIGDNLPTQLVGAVAYSAAGGGTVLALTGDNAMGSVENEAGQGIFWSSDLGQTWHKAAGAPDGVLGFRLAVRADQPATVYAATGAGLFRSTDAGRTWRDTRLPTGPCAGRTTAPNCFVANIVTDVQVQSADKFGHRGGAVVAAVGWSQGAGHRSFDGVPEAPGNGMYVSPTGEAGTFTRAGKGLPGPTVFGRTALGAASGPDQNHNYVYALVQDAKLLATDRLEGLDRLPDLGGGDEGPLSLTSPTYLNGVYVSADFGRHWSLMADRHVFSLPTNGSSLALIGPVQSYSPGAQAWYNEWITPDPGAQLGGVPTNLFLGLEEVWQTRTAGLPQRGPTDFYAVAPYSNLGGGFAPCIAVAAVATDCDPLTSTRPPSAHPDTHAGIVLPAGGTQPASLLVGTDGGAFRAAIPKLGLIHQGAWGNGQHAGLNTLIAYSVAPTKDGRVYSGLQDNGTVRLDPAGGMRPIEIFGGDGTYVVTDPHDGRQALFTTPGSSLTATHDFGRTKDDVEPVDGVRGKVWLTPFVLDETDASSLLYGARDIYAAHTGIRWLTAEAWRKAFDLGTQAHPGSPSATGTDEDPNNTATVMAMRSGTAYVGFCSQRCTLTSQRTHRFSSGIATNAGGKWHIAEARGLPNRLINGIAIDPANPSNVYVALGASTLTPWIPAGALGHEGVSSGGGHLYRSTDGAKTFTDISAGLPDTGVSAVLVRGQQLVVATSVGPLISSSLTGSTWTTLGQGFPSVEIWQLAPDPGDPDRVYAATYGRGIWRYRFPR